MARPTKLTPEIAGLLTKAVERGHFLETAAALAGVDKTTFWRWLKRGAKEKHGPYRDLKESLDKGMATAEDLCVTSLIASSDSQNMKWILERRFSERWARKEKLEVTGQDGGPVTFAEVMDAAFQRQKKLREERLREQGKEGEKDEGNGNGGGGHGDGGDGGGAPDLGDDELDGG